jgi:hypothetical protein
MTRAPEASWAIILAAAGLALAVLIGMDAARAQPAGDPAPQICCIYLIF